MPRESRVDHLETLLNCKIIQRVQKGESLEKYHAKLNDKFVLLRIFNSDYYGNRFLREGIALRYLNDRETSFRVPSLIEEWPEYRVRAVEWIEMDIPSDLDLVKLALSDLQNMKNIQTPYSLKRDLINHLTNVSTMHIAYQEVYQRYLEEILSQVPWDNSVCFVHGDLHYGNMGISDNKLIIYDWEYSSLGSSNYDQAYFDVIEDTKLLPEDIGNIWRVLATAAITHWYLQDRNFSPKMADKWIQKLKKNMEMI